MADPPFVPTDFEAHTGFTFTVLEPVTGDVIGCVYLYPSESPHADVTVQSWVRASHSERDVPLGDAGEPARSTVARLHGQRDVPVLSRRSSNRA